MRKFFVGNNGKQEDNTIKGKIKKVSIKLLVVSLLIVGAISCILNYWTLYKSIVDSLQTTAQVAAGQVSYYLSSVKNAAEVVGSIQQLTDENVSEVDKQAILDEYSEHFGWLGTRMTDATGSVLGDSSSSVAGEDYFVRAVKGETVITDPVYSPAIDDYVIIVAAPLWENGDFNTKVSGTVIATLAARDLSENIIAKIRISENGGAYVLNTEGTEIAAEFYEFVGWNTIKESENDSSYKPLAKIEKKMIAGESGFGTYLFMGTPKYIGYVPIGVNGWSIGVTAPISDFTDGTILSIIVIVLMLIIMSVVGKKICEKLGTEIGDAVRSCSERLQLLAKGDLSTEVPSLNTKDETHILENSTREIVTSQRTIIGDISYLLHEMANSNFDVKTKIGEDAYTGEYFELLESLRVLKAGMTETLYAIVEASNQVDAGSEQLAFAAQDLAEGATNQASAIEELFATVSNVAAQVEKNNEGTIVANKRIKEIGNEAVQSEKKMYELTEDMQNIKDTSDEINKIISEIEEIAEQTNLLSLNASIEAARAGEAGRGFAVVADQIGKLAEQSAESAVNTRHMIEACIQEVNKGNEATKSTAEYLNRVMEGLEEVTELIAEIQEASGTQTIAVEQIKQGVEDISNVVSNNSAAAEETSATSEELSAQAETMHELVGKFRLEERL